MKDRLKRCKKIITNHWQILFFVAGFIFDLITLGKIDDQFNIVQHIIYLVFASAYLFIDLKRQIQKGETTPQSSSYWKYAEWIFHFIIGSLLSVFTIFFFKSSNVSTSLLFLCVIVACLIINEFSLPDRFKNIIRSILYSICITCFFIYFIPLLLGKVNASIFYSSMLLSLVLQILPFVYLYKKFHSEEVKRKVLLPMIFTNLFFSLCYFTKSIPPIPMSIKKSGVYRDIQKEDDRYILTYKKPWWAFWRKGEQVFYHKEGDKVYIHFAIYSPAQFDNSIFIKWFYKTKKGWQKTDKIPLRVFGGRQKGYRSYTYKSNMAKGHWYVAAFTEDNRELGRIYLEVVDHSYGEDYPIKKDSY